MLKERLAKYKAGVSQSLKKDKDALARLDAALGNFKTQKNTSTFTKARVDAGKVFAAVIEDLKLLAAEVGFDKRFAELVTGISEKLGERNTLLDNMHDRVAQFVTSSSQDDHVKRDELNTWLQEFDSKAMKVTAGLNDSIQKLKLQA